jgi:hypothetical protein
VLYVVGMLLQRQGGIALAPRDKDSDVEGENVPLYTVADDYEDLDDYESEMHVPKVARR